MQSTSTRGQLTYLSVAELLDGYKQRSLSPKDVIEAVLARIDAVDAAVNAFARVDRAGALAAAEASARRWQAGAPVGPLDGVPTTVKDLLLMKGESAGMGSKVMRLTAPADEDSPAVARLKEAGAILIGTTHSPEIGWKAVTDGPAFGVTRNPWNTERTPGGSSGGAAAAAALGMGTLHIGTDGGGSIRIPAGFTGIAGLKPSFGRVPAYPASAFGTVAHVGPMARSIADCAAMLNVLAKPDVRDWFALPGDGIDYLHGLGCGIKGLRVAYSPDLGYVKVDPEVASVVAKAAKLFEALGASVEEVDPGFDCPLDIFHKHWFSGALNRTRDLTPRQIGDLDPGLQEIIAEARGFSLLDYMQAVDRRAALGRTMRRFHETYDLLITPTLPLPAFDAGLEFPAGGGYRRWTEWAAFSYPFNLTQQPAASVPCGFTSDGLPVGLQIVGPMHQDAAVLRAASAFEAACPPRFPVIVNPGHQESPEGEGITSVQIA
ncbi:amidase [Pelagibius sp. 7325]|uniref:amidase n=1 Tax=Pelagibius sp. 7325 TaxID=3131994 RepID=UPI0030EE390C